MIRFSYFISTLLAGLFLHLLVNRYLTIFGVGPNVLLLIVVTHGFFYGSLSAEMMGFSMGLVADALGTNLFGLQSLILTILGYLAGRLRRRVASERPTGQLVIGFVSTMFYSLGISFVGQSFESGIQRAPFLSVLVSGILNALVMPVMFFVVERWSLLWRENQLRLSKS